MPDRRGGSELQHTPGHTHRAESIDHMWAASAQIRVLGSGGKNP
jgi:hypothetical protein